MVEEETPTRVSRPHSQLQRMTSFTQRLRGSHRRTSSTATPARTSWLAPSGTGAEEGYKDKHDDEYKDTVTARPRPRSFYVPTHAAASFARTVAPLSPVRIEPLSPSRIEAKIEEDELENAPSSKRPSSRGIRSSVAAPARVPAPMPVPVSAPAPASAPAASKHAAPAQPRVPVHARTQSTPHRTSICTAQNDVNATCGLTPAPRVQKQQQHQTDTEYAAFLADAEAAERA
ncbi:hypothetical protein E4U21_006295, partial [Claviceps maximensis]